MIEPMVSSGINVDIVSGRPVEFPRQSQTEKTQVKYHQAIQDSLNIMQELQDSPILVLLVQKYAERLEILAREDRECQTIENILSELRYKVELAPKLAEKNMVRLMGGTLAAAYKKAKQAAP